MDKKVKFILIISVGIIISGILRACQSNSKTIDNREYEITNINIYKDTPAWELALAVRDQKVATIKKIIKNEPNVLNYQEPKYGATLLLWAIGMEKYNSAEALLKSGADPNIASVRYKTYGEETPLSLAAGFSWVDTKAKKDAKYVKLLIKYGADPNWCFIGDEHGIEPGTSILMESIGCGIEKTKALVEAGADINQKTQSGYTVATKALDAGGPNTTLEGIEYAYYLIVEKKANVLEPFYRRKSYGNEDPNEKFFPVNILRYWVYDLGSKEYKMKMEIVEEFARQGVNYWETEIPNSALQQIKKLYPNTWEEYIKKY
ncbi:ankyrin repeat domain-containing protein [Clostridium sp.]|uniref:ankyrin repeat domain-containing protein n=1 Tax=Clostridium sp. TaxID=1506 RepID=UPI00261D61EF|nr:ankyrin repeat domain-containing protein [Clostridium sp.]